MHIPDGMLDTKTWTTMWAGAAGCVGYASYWVRKHFDSSKVVLMAVLAALVFGLQMLNFPIAGGTSGHFGGGVAAGIILGPWPASLVMSAVLLVQAIFFGDGGVTTLGANIINMGIIAPFVGWAVYQAVRRFRRGVSGQVLASFVAAFTGVVTSAAAVALELWASGNAQFFTALGAMVSWHALIGIGEGVITAGLIAYIAKVRPSILEDGQGQAKASMRSVSITIGIVALVAAGLSFLASTHPDGLEYVYHTMGVGKPFAQKALIHSPIPDYLFPGIANAAVGKAIAGVIGVAITGLMLWAVVASVKRRRARDGAADSRGGGAR